MKEAAMRMGATFQANKIERVVISHTNGIALNVLHFLMITNTNRRINGSAASSVSVKSSIFYDLN